MASCGYGYSRSEVVDMASEYAIFIGKWDKEHPLTLKWFTLFMKRWPELEVLKPCGLEIQRAKATNKESVSVYNPEQGNIMDKYDLKHKPDWIYNVDEKGLSTSHKCISRVTDQVGITVITLCFRTHCFLAKIIIFRDS
ncbi:hypothetical protein DPMN_033963 [Dreissena polymorpha]|uniref:Uncharacterized protein n=1 Tax=Dreissena polymorpha TaxID=45954 RepID=A0A9D4M5V9_DREPO|nr:hypothetical protein DPMN_033963 [Dreissena polymorpha]